MFKEPIALVLQPPLGPTPMRDGTTRPADQLTPQQSAELAEALAIFSESTGEGRQVHALHAVLLSLGLAEMDADALVAEVGHDGAVDLSPSCSSKFAELLRIKLRLDAADTCSAAADTSLMQELTEMLHLVHAHEMTIQRQSTIPGADMATPSVMTNPAQLQRAMAVLGETLTDKEASNFCKKGVTGWRDGWIRVLLRAKDCRAYVSLYKRHTAWERLQIAKLEETEEYILRLMEWRLPVQNIMAFRELADTEAGAEEAKLLKAEAAKPWFGGMFSWSSAETTTEGGNLAVTLSDEERRELFSSMELKEDVNTAGYVKFQANLSLAESTYMIALDASTPLLQVSFEMNCLAKSAYTQLEDGTCKLTSEYTLSCGKLDMEDCATQSINYGGILRDHAGTAEGDVDVMTVGLKMTPVGSANVLTIDVPRVLQLVYNPAMMEQLVYFFQIEKASADAEVKTWVEYTETAVAAAAELEQELVDAVASAADEFEAFKVRATIQAPVLLLPEDVSRDDGPVIVCDFGSLDITMSHHGGAHSVGELQQAEERSSGFFVNAGHEDFCEKIELKMSDMQVRVLSTRESGDWESISAGADGSDCLMLPTTATLDMGLKIGAWGVNVDVGDIAFHPSPVKMSNMRSIVTSIQSKRTQENTQRSESEAQLRVQLEPETELEPESDVSVPAARQRATGAIAVRFQKFAFQWETISASTEELCIAANVETNPRVFCSLGGMKLHTMDLPVFQSIGEDAGGAPDVIRVQYATEVPLAELELDGDMNGGKQYGPTLPHSVKIELGAVDLEWHQVGIMSALESYHHLDAHLQELIEVLETGAKLEAGLTRRPTELQVDTGSDPAVGDRSTTFFKLKLDAKRVCATMFLPAPGTDGPQDSALLNFTVGNADLVVEYTAAHHYYAKAQIDEMLLLDEARPTMYPVILGPFQEGQTVFIELEVNAAQTMRTSFDAKVTPFKAVYCYEFFDQVTTCIYEAQQLRVQLGESELRATPTPSDFAVPIKRLFLHKAQDDTFGIIISEKATVDIVNSGSPAAAAGVTVGDAIVEVNGTAVGSDADVKRVLSQSQANFAEFGLLDGWQFSADIVLDMHLPHFKYVAKRDSRATTILSSTRILVKQTTKTVTAVTMEDSEELTLNLNYLADFGGCTAPVMDAKLTLSALQVDLPVPLAKSSINMKVDYRLNIDARTWNPMGGKWERFVHLGAEGAGASPSTAAITTRYQSTADTISTISVKTPNTVPTIRFSAGTLEWLAQAARSDCADSTVENLCGVQLDVFCPDGQHKELDAGATGTFATQPITDQYSAKTMPELNIMIRGYEPALCIPIFEFSDSEYVLWRGEADGQDAEQVRIVCIVEVVNAAVRVHVKSTLEFVNKTQYDLEILTVNDAAEARSAGVVEGYGQLCVPTTLAGATECRVRHGAFIGSDEVVEGSPLLVADGVASNQMMTVSLPGGISLYFRAISSWTTHRRVTIEPAFYVTNLLAESATISLQSSQLEEGQHEEFERQVAEAGETVEYFSDRFGGLRPLDLRLELLPEGRFLSADITNLDSSSKDPEHKEEVVLLSADGSTKLRVTVLFTDPHHLVLYAPLWFCDRSMLPLQDPLLVECPSKEHGSEVTVGWRYWPGQNARASVASSKASVISMDTGGIDQLVFRVGNSHTVGLDISQFGESTLEFGESTLEWRGESTLQAIVDPAPLGFRRTKMVTIRPYRAITNKLPFDLYIFTPTGLIEVSQNQVVPFFFDRKKPLKIGCVLEAGSVTWSDDICVRDGVSERIPAVVGALALAVDVRLDSPEAAELLAVGTGDDLVDVVPDEDEDWAVLSTSSVSTGPQSQRSTISVTESLDLSPAVDRDQNGAMTCFDIDLSTVLVSFDNMASFSMREEVGPTCQSSLLGEGKVLDWVMKGVSLKGRRIGAAERTTYDGVESNRFDSTISVKQMEIRDTSKPVATKVFRFPRDAVSAKFKYDQSAMVDSVEYRGAIGRNSSIIVDIDDVFLLKLFAVQRNVMAAKSAMFASLKDQEELSPSAERRAEAEKHRSPLMDIIEGLRCELQRVTETSSDYQYFWAVFVNELAPLTVNFKRLTVWDQNQLLELIPIGMHIEETRITIPKLRLLNVLCDIQSLQQRLMQQIWPEVDSQMGNIISENLSMANVHALRKQATAGTRGSTLLAEKAKDLRFPFDDTLTDDDIVAKHMGKRDAGQGLKTAESLDSLDRRLWRLLCDWDANHVDDMAGGAVAGAAAGAALALVVPPLGFAAGVLAAVAGGVAGGTSAGHHRRCVVIAIHNRTARKVSITGVQREQATNLVEATNQHMQPFKGSWEKANSTVIFAAASAPTGRAVFETGMLELMIDSNCLRIQATSDYLRLHSKDERLCFNIVSMDVHHWWSRWVLVLSDATVNVLPAPEPSSYTVSSVEASLDKGSVTLTFDEDTKLEPEQAPAPEPAPAAVDLGLRSVPGTSPPTIPVRPAASGSPDTQAICDMGFTEDQARQSLSESGGDVERAIDRLLGGGGGRATPVVPDRPKTSEGAPIGTVCDAQGGPLFGEFCAQMGGDHTGKFTRVTVQAARGTHGGELILSKPHDPALQKRMGLPIVLDLTTPGTRVGCPKTPRDGRPYCVRVTLGRRDSRHVDKYVIDFASNGQMIRWLTCLGKLHRGEQFGYTLRRRQGVSGGLKDTVAEGRKARGGRADDDNDYEVKDWVRGVAAKGKQERMDKARLSGASGPAAAAHAQRSDYKFGDFTRGLFGGGK